MLRTVLLFISFLFVFIAKAETDSERTGQSKATGYRNTISVAPYQITDESLLGIGIQFERFLNRREKVSFYLPAAVSFCKDNHGQKSTYTYLYPGFKIYPWGNRPLSYSIGPSLGFGFGKKYSYSDILWNGAANKEVTEYNTFISGIMVNNGVNVRTGRFYAGAELGIGVICYSSPGSYLAGNFGWIQQFQCKAGYCF